jgi:Spy/CpxP family protein refolding chaperone
MNGRNKWLMWIIAVVVLMNVAILGSYWWTRKPHYPPQLEKIFEKELSLTPEQTAEFRTLDKVHRTKAKELHKNMESYKSGLFEEMLSDNSNEMTLDSINLKIGATQIAMDENLMEHYSELKKLCTSAEQKEKLKELFKKITKRPPPPPREK